MRPNGLSTINDNGRCKTLVQTGQQTLHCRRWTCPQTQENYHGCTKRIHGIQDIGHDRQNKGQQTKHMRKFTNQEANHRRNTTESLFQDIQFRSKKLKQDFKWTKNTGYRQKHFELVSVSIFLDSCLLLGLLMSLCIRIGNTKIIMIVVIIMIWLYIHTYIIYIYTDMWMCVCPHRVRL